MKKSKFYKTNNFSIQIDKLKSVNAKLRNKIKDLNTTVERAIEKANAKRLFLAKKEAESS